MTTHCLPASVDTCHWGQFDPNLRAVLTVQSGDTLIVDTVSGGPEAAEGGADYFP